VGITELTALSFCCLSDSFVLSDLLAALVNMNALKEEINQLIVFDNK